MKPIHQLLLIIALTAMWSPSYLFIKLAVEDLPPLTIVNIRVMLAAFIFLMILKWKKTSLPSTVWFWIHSTMMAIFSSAIPFTLFCYAEQSIDSALAAILNGGSPMFTAILAHLLIPSDKLTMQKTAGVALSTIGLVFLFVPTMIEGVSGTMFGMLAAILASLSYGISHVYAKKFAIGQAPFVAPAAQLISCTILLLPFTFWIDQPFNLEMPSLTAMGGVLGLTMLGTVLAFTIYYKLIESAGAIAVSMVACFFPVIGTVLGFVFLNETLSFANLLASVVILLGMMLVNGVIQLNAKTVAIRDVA